MQGAVLTRGAGGCQGKLRLRFTGAGQDGRAGDRAGGLRFRPGLDLGSQGRTSLGSRDLGTGWTAWRGRLLGRDIQTGVDARVGVEKGAQYCVSKTGMGTSCVTRKAAIHPPKSPWSSIQRFSAAVRWPPSVVRKPKANSSRSYQVFPRVHRCDHDDKGGSKTSILLRYSIPPRSIMTSTDGRTKRGGRLARVLPTYHGRYIYMGWMCRGRGARGHLEERAVYQGTGQHGGLPASRRRI